MELKKQELTEIRKNKMQGHMIRSRMQWVAEGERPSKYFCALEKSHFLEKTIKCLCKDDMTYTRDQQEILHEIKNFYENLYKAKENIGIGNLQEILRKYKVRTLAKEHSRTMEGYLTITELGNALKNTKNNKTPGLDGIPFEFLKVFWKDMKFCVTKAINFSFDKGTLPPSLRQCVITCLPKKGKPRDRIKNWRPLSMLSVIYKLASAAIANRIKPYLNGIIDTAQSGFVPGRYIGECTRLVYDLMKFTEDKHIPGMLVLIDFEKAFDSISWSFIYQSLSFLGFPTDIVSWVKLFNNNIKATVTQCGVLSDFIDIEQGCRQGDPIAPYLFIIVAQILTVLIKNNNNIQGIKIEDEEIKLTQFADDTTLILNGSSESLQAALNTLEIFGSYSGLKVNTDKTQIVWIGKKKNCKDSILVGHRNFSTISQFKLLGIDFSVDLDKCVKTNYDRKIAEIQETISKWNKRYLTPLGKVTVIKTFLLAKLNHLFLALPNPGDMYISEISNIFYRFIWSSKPDKISRFTLTLDKKLGGLKTINLKNHLISLKVTWVRRLLLTEETTLWTKLFVKTFKIGLDRLIQFGPEYYNVMKKRTRNKFWLDVFDAWQHLTNIIKIQNNTDLLSSPLWYNKIIPSKDMYLPKWLEKGIVSVSDILKSDGSVMTLDEIRYKYNFTSINRLHFLRVQRNVKDMIKKHKSLSSHNIEAQRPFVPFYLIPLWKNKKGASGFNAILSKNNENKNKMKTHWEIDLEINIDADTWRLIFNICHKTVNNNYLIWFQMKLLYRILNTKSYLYKLKISDNELCNHCNRKESILHMFVECNRVQDFWREIENLIQQKIGLIIHFLKMEIILGYFNKDNNRTPLNVIMLVTKKYILDTSQNKGVLNVLILKYRLSKAYEDEKYFATLTGKEGAFLKIWEKWYPLFEK